MSSDRLRRMLVGVRIEGLGEDTAKDGLCLYYSAGAPPTLPAGLALEWRQGLTRVPQGVSTSVDVWTSRWQVGALSLSVSYAHATRLLASQTVTQMELEAALDASATDVEIDDPTLGGRVVWVEDEAILLGGWSGAAYTGCVRGCWGTRATSHTAGQPVYKRLPAWQLRLVEIYSLDLDTGDEQLRWRGYLTSRKTSGDGTTIELGAEEYFATWRRGQANRTPRDLNAGGALRVNRWGSISGALLDAQGAYSTAQLLSAAAIATGDAGVAAQLGGALVALDYDATGRLLYKGPATARLGSAIKVTPADEQRQYQAYLEPVWELVAWDRVGDLAREPGLPPISPTWGTPDTWHPLRIGQILLRSSGEGSADPLSALASLALEHIDWTTWEAEIARTPWLQIDQIVLGWDGEAWAPLEVVEQLLRALGYYFAPQSDGRLTIKRLVTLDLAGYAEARAQRTTFLPGTLELVPAPDVGLTELHANVGETPFDAPRRIRISARGSSPRAAYLGDARRWELELPYWRQAEAERLALELAQGASLVHYALPRLKIRVPDPQRTGIDASIGRYLTLDASGLATPWILDREGALIPPEDMPTRIDLVGLVVGSRARWEDLTYDLEVLLIAWHTGAYTRERAPSAEILWSDATDVGIEEPVFGDSPSDAQGFWVGDQVEIYSYTGVELEGPYTVISAAPGYVELDGAISATEGILRLAESGSYANSARYSFEPRPYVYYAEAGQIIRPGGLYDSADLYGGGLGLG